MCSLVLPKFGVVDLAAVQSPLRCGWAVCSRLSKCNPHGLVHLSPAPAAFLVSLYVKDVWLGAQQPDTFLHHVRMVCDAAEDGPHGEAEAIVLLCRNIDSLTQTPDSPLPASAPAGSRRLRARFPGGVN